MNDKNIKKIICVGVLIVLISMSVVWGVQPPKKSLYLRYDATLINKAEETATVYLPIGVNESMVELIDSIKINYGEGVISLIDTSNGRMLNVTFRGKVIVSGVVNRRVWCGAAMPPNWPPTQDIDGPIYSSNDGVTIEMNIEASYYFEKYRWTWDLQEKTLSAGWNDVYFERTEADLKYTEWDV